MSTLITYISRHGCAAEAAQILKDKLSSDTEIHNLKDKSALDLSAYDTIIVGGSIHAGQVQSVIKKFCQNNFETLLTKKLGFYLCCMEEGDKAKAQFENAFPAELREHATASGLFGGAFNFERMNFLERVIIKKVAKVSESVSKLNKEMIAQFAKTISV